MRWFVDPELAAQLPWVRRRHRNTARQASWTHHPMIPVAAVRMGVDLWDGAVWCCWELYGSDPAVYDVLKPSEAVAVSTIGDPTAGHLRWIEPPFGPNVWPAWVADIWAARTAAQRRPGCISSRYQAEALTAAPVKWEAVHRGEVPSVPSPWPFHDTLAHRLADS